MTVENEDDILTSPSHAVQRIFNIESIVPQLLIGFPIYLIFILLFENYTILIVSPILYLIILPGMLIPTKAVSNSLITVEHY